MSTCTTNSTTTADGLTTTATEIGYGCAPVCTECLPPISQTLTLNVEQGESFNQVLNPDSSVPQTATSASTDGWAVVDVVAGQAVVSGTAPNVEGTYPQVIMVANECGQATVVVKVIVAPPPCTPPTNVAKNFVVKSDGKSVEGKVTLSAAGQTIVTSNLPDGMTANIYGSALVIGGSYTGALPAAYSITVKTDCGNFDVTGSLTECVAIIQTGSTGSSEFTNGVPVTYCLDFNGTGITVAEVTGIPAGVSYVITEPTAATSKICLTGAPSGLAQTGEVAFKLANSCGTLAIKMPWTKKEPAAGVCVETAKISETGAQTFTYGTAGSLCYTYTGQALTMINADTPPLGLSIAVSGTGPWTVCLSGTAVLDVGVGEGNSGSVSFELKGDCGTTSHSIPYIIPKQSTAPAFCIGIFEYDTSTNVLTVWGAAPNSTVDIIGASPATLSLDSVGYGTVTLTPTAIAPACVEISHPTCGLVKRGYTVLDCP